MGDSQGEAPVDADVSEVRAARDDGFATVWSPQLPWERDLLTTQAIALREVDGASLGSAVLPIQSRLAMVMAQQALTLSLLSGGRFKLGIGPTHELISDGMWGIPWDRPVRRLNEYLDALLPLLDGVPADASGETPTARHRRAIGATGIDELGVAVLQRDPDDVARTRAFLRTYL